MKFSLICTVYNEGKSMKDLLDSIFKQTRVPDEIIIVDSLSKDNTVEIIRSFKDKRINLIEKKADIGIGRNIAIKAAKYDIILATDGGCVLDKYWCEEMLKPFEEKKANVVGSVYKPLPRNFFEECEGIIVCKPIEKINEKRYLPSSRGIGFKKSAWKAVGGYPKHTVGGEDTLFVLRLKQKGLKIIINKKAIVYWRMRSPLKNFIRQYYLYAVGDAKTGNVFKMKANLLFVIGVPLYLVAIIVNIFFYPVLSLILSGLLLLYFLYQGFKVAIKTRKIKGFFYGFWLCFFKRFAYVFGIWRDWFWSYKGGYKNENY